MVVKTVSGSVASWPATGIVTTRPLPVLDTIQTLIDDDTKEATIVWEPNPDSLQDEYKITYYELETYINNDNINNGDSSSIYVEDTFFSLSNLQPGRNYSISISAVAQGIESIERPIYQATSEYNSIFISIYFINNNISCFNPKASLDDWISIISM